MTTEEVRQQQASSVITVVDHEHEMKQGGGDQLSSNVDADGIVPEQQRKVASNSGISKTEDNTVVASGVSSPELSSNEGNKTNRRSPLDSATLAATMGAISILLGAGPVGVLAAIATAIIANNAAGFFTDESKSRVTENTDAHLDHYLVSALSSRLSFFSKSLVKANRESGKK